MKLIIGIDDTDNLESRGTGFIARQLGLSLMNNGFADLHSITRHQLLVDSRIPYTSHNSSASIICYSKTESGKIIDFCSDFLTKESADDSDAGLCIADYEAINHEIIDWGHKAKKEVLKLEDSHFLASKNNLFLQGFKGYKIGVIGSLAAVGLRKGGNDGRLLWLKNLRDLQGIYIIKNLPDLFSIDCVSDKSGNTVPENEKINITDWCRPVLIENKITLIVEEEKNNGQFQWKCASKEYIKSISQ
jgi:hypothetical protein